MDQKDTFVPKIDGCAKNRRTDQLWRSAGCMCAGWGEGRGGGLGLGLGLGFGFELGFRFRIKC